MADQTKEALAATIRELGRQNDELQRKIVQLMKSPRSERVITGCLGFGFHPVPENGNKIITALPQVIFRPDRFCVSRQCAPHFVINDIKIGMTSQFLAPGAIPANLFAVENVHRLREFVADEDFDAAIPLTFDTAPPGVFVTINVTRIDASEMPFECAMVGETLGMYKEALPEGPVTIPTNTSN